MTLQPPQWTTKQAVNCSHSIRHRNLCVIYVCSAIRFLKWLLLGKDFYNMSMQHVLFSHNIIMFVPENSGLNSARAECTIRPQEIGSGDCSKPGYYLINRERCQSVAWISATMSPTESSAVTYQFLPSNYLVCAICLLNLRFPSKNEPKGIFNNASCGR